jgi:hypothetical protein
MNSKYGYWLGGQSPGPTTVSTVDRVNFSNDLVNASIRGPLTTISTVTHTVGNKNYMYNNSSNTTTVTRIDFSNDTALHLSRGNIQNTHTRGTGVYNSNFGYFGGGYQVNTVIDRVNFSNDTSTGVRVGNLSQGRGDLNGLTNASNA